MSAQEHAALKIQDAWREWLKLNPLCTCTTTFYPDGDRMIPEKHVCLRCYERMEEEKENAALKIQDAWRKYLESKDSCPICLKIIGEDSCTGLKAVQRNGSCPLCRSELTEDNRVEEVEDLDAASYQFNLSDKDYENAVNESLDASYSYQCGYSEGIERGRREAEEEIRLLKEENKRLKQRNSRMREDIQFHTQRFYSPSI